MTRFDSGLSWGPSLPGARLGRGFSVTFFSGAAAVGGWVSEDDGGGADTDAAGAGAGAPVGVPDDAAGA